jgi:hypothetical protein
MSEAISEGICPVSWEKKSELTAFEARGLWEQIFQLSRNVPKPRKLTSGRKDEVFEQPVSIKTSYTQKKARGTLGREPLIIYVENDV